MQFLDTPKDAAGSAIVTWETISVSPIGTGQGHTTNNGADFGPDTPGTTTGGWQEALNHIGSATSAHIRIRGGGTHTFAAGTPVGISTQVSGSSPPASPLALTIEGEGTTGLPQFFQGKPAGGAIISATPSGAANRILNFSGALIDLDISAITIVQPLGANMWHAFGLDTGANRAVKVKHCVAAANNNTALVPSVLGSGPSSDGTMSGFLVSGGPFLGVLENCHVLGHPTAFTGSSQTHLIACGAGYCGTLLNVSGVDLDHPIRVAGMAAAACGVFIQGPSSAGQVIGDMSIEWATSGAYALTHFVNDPSNNLYGDLFLTGHVVGPDTPNTAPIPLATLNNNGGQHFAIRQIQALGYGVTTPAVPGGTGSANKVTNTNPCPVRIYQTGEVGTHIIDPSGTDHALPADLGLVVVDQGAAIYYATTVPSSWLWYGA